MDLTSKISESEIKYQNSVGSYLSDKVIPTIKEYVYNARKRDKTVPLHWKNNNCSLNHILKMNQNWTRDRLPEPIRKLHNPKKRELSSPEDSTETKKNSRVAQMLTTSGMATEGAVAGSGDNPVFTLSDEQLERIAGFMYTTFQPQIAKLPRTRSRARSQIL